LSGTPAPPVWKQTVIVAVQTVLLALLWHAHLLADYPINDELSYTRAIDFVLEGRSPYNYGGYLYPPLLAVVGAGITESYGSPAFLWLLRCLCYLGLVVTVWLAAMSTPWRRWYPYATAAYLALAPAVYFGLVVHNISLAVAGSTLVALWVWRRRPITSGVLLGLGAVLKPMVFLIPFLLFMHRPKEGGWHHRLAGGIGIGITGLLLLLPPYLGEMFSLATRAATIPRSVSVHRLTYLAGWEEGTLWVSGVVALCAVWVVRRSELGWSDFLVVSVVASLMATPVLWSHTLLMALPLQTMALERLYRRYRNGASFRFEWALVILAVLALQLSGGATSIDDQGLLLQVSATLPVALAPLVLALYLGRAQRPVGAPAG
jgi:hypothetical protein